MAIYMRAIEFTQVFSYLAVLLEYIDTTEHLCMYGLFMVHPMINKHLASYDIGVAMDFYKYSF